MTKKEQAILDWGIAFGVDDWKQLYTLSRERVSQATDKSITEIASKWKNSGEIVDYWEMRKKTIPQELKHRFGFETTESGSGDEFSNFETIIDGNLSKEQLLQILYKRLANSTSDSATASISNAINNIMQFNKDKPKEKEDTVKYYLPLRCYDCVLYKNAKEELGTE